MFLLTGVLMSSTESTKYEKYKQPSALYWRIYEYSAHFAWKKEFA